MFTHVSRGLALSALPRNPRNPALGNKLEQRRSHWGHHIDLWTLFQIFGAGDGTEDKSALLVQF
jgi:hypothetical protein